MRERGRYEVRVRDAAGAWHVAWEGNRPAQVRSMLALAKPYPPGSTAVAVFQAGELVEFEDITPMPAPPSLAHG
ncbi:MAG: hypothetical protein IT370_09340 [Deltaproteobacteria bacterium]|nr:hypothetical protein [Deltaproteobacteria bacterium]